MATATGAGFVIDAVPGSRLAGHFQPGTIVEVEGDGVARAIVSATDATARSMAIKISPKLADLPVRPLLVRNWLAEAKSLKLDLGPAATGPGAGRGRASTIDTLQYQAGCLDGTGARNLPFVPRDVSCGPFYRYPYDGLK